jgi:hypothetical protein
MQDNIHEFIPCFVNHRPADYIRHRESQEALMQ